MVKETCFRKGDLISNYVTPLVELGVSQKDIIAFSLSYNDAGKAPSKLIHEYLGVLLKALDALGVTTIYCADAAYFKVLARKQKAAPHLGYNLPVGVKGFEHMSVVLGVNHKSILHNPNNQSSLTFSLNTLGDCINGTYEEVGKDIIRTELYVHTVKGVKDALDALLHYPEVTADIEAFSLKHYAAGVATLGLATDKHNGVVIRCDYEPCDPYELEVWDKKDKVYKKKTAYGKYVPNPEIRALIKEFLINYTGTITWHNASYDVKALIYTLWMETLIDHRGLLEGLEIMTENINCTQLITYLATNNCAQNKLSLKDAAHEFAGNYAQEDINDIRLIPIGQLQQYNLIDCLCTWYVKEKNYPIMVQDQQEELYLGLFKESLKTIIQMELTGMPMCMEEVKKGKQDLLKIFNTHNDEIQKSDLVKQTIRFNQLRWIEKDFVARQSKAKNPDKIVQRTLEDLLTKAPAAFPKVFNPNSGTQVAVLLHDIIGLPVIEETDTGLPATDDDTLEKLINHTQDTTVKELIEHIRTLLGVSKILSTFIPAFEEAQLGPDGIYRLFGCFKLGGTKSGRLSSNSPNLQNLPSGSTYAKVVKRMFKGNGDWLFVGSDYNALISSAFM